VSPTSTETVSPPTIPAVIPITPQSTATPFVHEVARGETMLGVALRYGVNLDDLKAANPGIDPNFLSVGTALIIPLNGEILQVVPTSTPVPVRVSEPSCYRSGDDGACCLLLVKNDQQSALENFSAWFGLYSVDGELLSGQVAVGSINRVSAGQSLPLATFFEGPLPLQFTVRAELLTAMVVSPEDTRYLPASIELLNVDIQPAGVSAIVKGQIILPGGDLTPRQLGLLAVAYGKNGEVVGFRKWEAQLAANETVDLQTPSSTQTITSTPEIKYWAQDFQLIVYSLGSTIASVEVLVEAKR
jgi:LysM repeat protein